MLRSSAGRRGSRVALRVTARGVHSPQLRDDEWELARTLTDGLAAEQVWRFPPAELDGFERT